MSIGQDHVRKYKPDIVRKNRTSRQVSHAAKMPIWFGR